MAYVSKETKAKLQPKIKSVLKKYGVSGTVSAPGSKSTLNVNISKGSIDFIKNYNEAVDNLYSNDGRDSHIAKHGTLDVNQYWYHQHFTGRALDFMTDLFCVMNEGNHNNSDIQTDYFDVGWYVNVHVGKWQKPYLLETQT